MRAGDVTRTETPGPGVTIYRDTHDVPHVYGDTDQTLAFGAGYAQAEDRLFLMDVLRHYGAGTLAALPRRRRCEFEQMDHDQLLLAPYTPAQAQAQVDALPDASTAREGALAKSMIDTYVARRERLHRQRRRPTRASCPPTTSPRRRTAAPQPWTDADVVAIAGLIGGIFGKGGGTEIANAQLLQLPAAARSAPTAGDDGLPPSSSTQNDPLAPTTVVDKSFPYETAGHGRPASRPRCPTPAQPLTGGPAATAPGLRPCTARRSPTGGRGRSSTALKATAQAHEQRARRRRRRTPAPATRSPSSGRRCPTSRRRSCRELDLHSPDYDAEGASFPGTGLVELGRGAGLRLVGDLGRQRPDRPAPGADLQPGRRRAGRRRHATTCSTGSACR